MVYPARAVHLYMVVDVHTDEPQTGETPETSDGKFMVKPSRYHTYSKLALRQSFLHRFLISASAEEAHIEMFFVYLMIVN